MNDRFKFRAWHKEKQEMHNVDGLYAYDSEYTEGGEVFFKEDSDPKNSYYFPEEVEVMQCTGLKDKNGKLIYEGDIVTCYDNRPCAKSYPLSGGVITYNKACFVVKNEFSEHFFVDVDCVEVIGNIYENKELL